MARERGIVLIMVLWALMVLMVLAAELARSAHIEGLSTDVNQREVITYYLATAGLNRALYRILQAQQQGQNMLTPGRAFSGGLQDLQQSSDPNETMDGWVRGDGRWRRENFGAGGYWVRVLDEDGKLNLNQVEETTLRQVFTNIGFDLDRGQELTDVILDWRDDDQLVRLHGAESDYYLSLPVPYPAKDGPFTTVDELLLLRGVTGALYYGREGPALRDLFTVYSGSGGGNVNLLTANPLVLQAVLGIDTQTAHDLVRQRSEASEANLAGLFPGGGAGGTVNLGIPQVVTIESVGFLPESEVTRRVAAVIQRTGNGFQFLRWQDRVDGGEMPASGEEE